MRRLLVIGFGPFPGMRRNPSGEAARQVADSCRWRRFGIEARALVLSTTYAAVHEELRPALDERPDAVLMIGVAGRSRHVRVESRALNRASVLAPDADQVRPSRLVLELGASPRRTAANPHRAVHLLRRHGFASRTSIDAGRYLCNASYFAALSEPVPILFIHIPRPGRARLRRPGSRIRQTWPERLSTALAMAALDLLTQAR